VSDDLKPDPGSESPVDLAVGTPVDGTGADAHPPQKREIVRVLGTAAAGVVLIGSAMFGVSSMVHRPIPAAASMCVDSTCTYAMSAAVPQAAKPHPVHRSAPERLFRKVLYICHLG
jgi:hypothetical protein